MRIPRFTIKGLLIAVAVIAFDCFLVVEILIGVLLPAIGLNVGLVRILRREGREQRFWIAFEVTGLLTLGVYIGLLANLEEIGDEWPMTVLNFLVEPLSPAAQGFVAGWLDSAVAMIGLWIVVFEVTIGLPLVLFSAFVGWVVTRIAPGPVASLGPVERLMVFPEPSEA